MQVELQIMKKGDQVLNTWGNKISIKRENGEVEIFTLIEDENNLPRISPHSLLITFGKPVAMKIHLTEKNTINSMEDNDDYELGTY